MPAAYKLLQVIPDAIAEQLIANSNIPVDKSTKYKVHKELYNALKQCQPFAQFSVLLSVEVVDNDITQIKFKKAAGLDEMFPEFLKHLSPRARKWLTALFTNTHFSGRIPKE